MKNILKQALCLCLFTLLLAFAATPVSAAAAKDTKDGQATMKVKIAIDLEHIFWDYTFLRKDYLLATPSQVKVIWSTGVVPKGEKSETAITTGKKEGEVSITTGREELVSVQVAVCDAKGNKLGSLNLQVPNKGQTESITLAPPVSTEPQMNWSNL